MSDQGRIHFAPFDLDLVNECLWKGEQAIKLTPKAFAVLRHLVEHRGRLVTKDRLISAVWGDVFVGDGVLKVAVRQLRWALADDPKTPRFIETAHRRGYRFIGQVDAHGGSSARQPASPGRPALTAIALTSSDAMTRSPPWMRGSTARTRANGRSCSSAAKRESARQRWSMCSCAAGPLIPGC